MSWGWGEFGDYVSAAEKQRRADATLRKLEKQGRKLAPVRLSGRAIASSFWGKAWGQNLESYSDYASRLPRGRSYVRNGSVLDLQIQRGSVVALVSGTELYDIKIKIDALSKADWQNLKRECAGKVGSLIDLLRGKLSRPVMEIITRKEDGLFPKPKEIHLNCSCPDWADMCKHVAAALYAVGTRLDQQPELLFVLRGVDHLELITETTQNLAADLAAPVGATETLDESSLAEIFGIELDGAVDVVAAAVPDKPPAKRPKKLMPVAPRWKPPADKPVKTGKVALAKVAPKAKTTRPKKTPAKTKTGLASKPKKKPTPGALSKQPGRRLKS